MLRPAKDAAYVGDTGFRRGGESSTEYCSRKDAGLASNLTRFHHETFLRGARFGQGRDGRTDEVWVTPFQLQPLFWEVEGGSRAFC